MKNVHEILKNWENLSHDDKNEIINDHSAGCIEYGSNTFIEIFLFDIDDPFNHAILYMDHEDMSGINPFMTYSELVTAYDWEPSELIDQLDEYSDGPTKTTLLSLLQYYTV
jgi:hypothetical protein